MYLYFDKKGTLKEIINDEALRQGSYGVNKMYIYIDDLVYNSIDVSYLLQSNLVVGPLNIDDFTEEEYIPFDAKRDLRFFKYNKKYRFLVISLSEKDPFGNSALDEAGVVHCEMQAVLPEQGLLQLGDVNFNVEENAVLNQKQVASQEYLSLADYLFLRKLITGLEPIIPVPSDVYVPYTGANNDVNLGGHYLFAGSVISDVLSTGSSNRLFTDNSDLVIEADDGNIELSPNDKATYNGEEIAVKNELPKKNVVAIFSTSMFELSEGGNYVAEDIELTNFIADSDMIVITWDNCFAICPIPAIPEADGRVVAAMWNANGEAQTIRIRYAITDSNSLLQISLQGGFVPPSNHTAYVLCYKLITQ